MTRPHPFAGHLTDKIQVTKSRAAFSLVPILLPTVHSFIYLLTHSGDDKSMTQKLSDSTSTKPGEESYLDTAKKTIGDAVEYVEKTAEG